MAGIHRKKKLINSRLQLRLIGVFLAVSCVASLFQVVLLNRSMMDLAQRLPGDGDLLLGHLPTVLLVNIGLTFAVLAPLTFLIGLAVTHRVAGPAYNMTRYCQALARGEEPGPCKVRDKDELQDLCAALNAAVARLREDDGAAAAPGVEPPSLVAEGEVEREEAGSAPSPSEG